MPSFGLPTRSKEGQEPWLQRFAGNHTSDGKPARRSQRGEMQLNTDIINLFLETKDICKNSSTLINSRKSRMLPASIYLPGLASTGIRSERRNAIRVTRLSVVAKSEPQDEQSRNHRRGELSFRA